MNISCVKESYDCFGETEVQDPACQGTGTFYL